MEIRIAGSLFGVDLTDIKETCQVMVVENRIYNLKEGK